MNRYYLICQWVMRFLCLNGLWVGFTILGLGVFGLMPATAAMFAVARKWVSNDVDVPIFSTFWKSYKKEFRTANLAGLIFFAAGYLLVMELRILLTQESTVYLFGLAGAAVLLLILGVVVLYFFPVLAHYNLSLANYLKWPLILGITHPLLTVFLVVTLGCIYYFVYSSIPILLLLFGGSLTAYIVTWGVMKTFENVETRAVSVA